MNTTTIGARLSRQGLKAMYANGVTNGQEQGTIGESYLNSIRDQADVSAEKGVAKAASTACRSITTWRAQVALADSAMNTIAAGIAGPVGPAIAAASRGAMFSHILQKGQDQGVIGQSALASVHNETEDSAEKALAETAYKACSGVNQWRGQVAVADAALQAIQNGLGSDLGDTLASVGHQAVYSPHISTIHDQAVVGMRFTEAVARYSDDQEQKAAAEAALSAASRVTTARSQVGILGEFLAGR
ncbi:MAG: hypothetical protein KC800_16105 [Candidatus Eremiobacteraeota bacterium]|nr:hypothetical protein [Candidatus Eremiobacteraeota bacterium]